MKKEELVKQFDQLVSKMSTTLEKIPPDLIYTLNDIRNFIIASKENEN